MMHVHEDTLAYVELEVYCCKPRYEQIPNEIYSIR
jgi:hypothetical protein